MSTDRDGHTVTVVVRCGFIGCDWSMEIGTAALEAHEAYLEHLDVHDPDTITADCEAVEPEPIHPDRYIGQEAAFRAEYQAPSSAEMLGDLYAGDTPEQLAADQARFDRFMAGGADQ